MNDTIELYAKLDNIFNEINREINTFRFALLRHIEETEEKLQKTCMPSDHNDITIFFRYLRSEIIKKI